MKRGWLLVVGILIVAGTCLRWWGLGSRSLWFDEGYTHWVSSLSPGELIRMVRYDYTPPLYFLIAQGWSHVFGDSEFALRSWSALVASLTLVLVAAIAWQTTRQPWAMVLATALCAVSELQVEWGQTARAYASAMFVFTLAVWLLIQYLQNGRKIWLLLHALAAAVLVYQHNSMWFFLAGLNLGALLWPSPLTGRQRIASLAFTDTVVVLLFLPWLPGFLQQLHALDRAYFAESPRFYSITHNLLMQAGVELEWVRDMARHHLHLADPGDRIFRLGLFAVVCGLCVMSLLRQESQRRSRILAVMAFSLAPIALAFVYSNLRPSVWIEKSFIPASAMLPIILAAAVCAAWPRTVRVAAGLMMGIIILAATASSLRFVRHPPLEDWRSATQWVASQTSHDLAVIFVAAEGEMVHRYYSGRLHLPPVQTLGAPISFFTHNPPLTMTRVLREEDLRQMQERLAAARPARVVLVQAYTGWSDPKGIAQAYFDRQWKRVETRDYGGVRARLYEWRKGLDATDAVPGGR